MSRKLLFGWLVLFMAINAARTAVAIQQSNTLPDLPTGLPPMLLAASSALWAGYFAVCSWAVLQRWARARWLVAGGIGLYLAQQWLFRLIFSRSTESFQTLGVLAVTSAAALGVTVGLLWLSGRNNKSISLSST